MLVFNGGLTIEQVEKLKNGEFVIYNKVPYKLAGAKRKNTFDYAPKELYSAPSHIFKRYVSEDCYNKQYIFFARAIVTSLDFCVNCQQRNYIIVCDIAKEILENYIGVGNYDDYRIEYRLPRVYVTPDTIKDVLYFEPYDEEQLLEIRQKYKDYFYVDPAENQKAKQLILERNLEFNGERNWK